MQNLENNETQKFDITKIRAIFGLGNIGREYENTRHNVGFEFVETMAGINKFNEEKDLKALVSNYSNDKGKFFLIKPTTMMNMSGECVVKFSKFFKIEPHEILVVHDDLDLLIGRFKLQFSKGPKVHNGINSIENRMGTDKFWRLRIGVENRSIQIRKHIDGASYVLGKFKTEERDTLGEVYPQILDLLGL